MSLPSGYKRLEYIQSSGTQYVDTLFNPTQNTKLVLNMAFLGSAGTNVAGVRNNFGDTINRFGIISFGSTSKLGAFFRDSSIQAVTFDNNRHLYDLSKDGLVFDGTSYGGANTGSFSCTYSLTLFAWNNGANGVTCNLCKVYSCQIYDNGTIIRDYIPCQTTAGEIGLWDDVNSAFYGNAGTGTFTAGPVVAIAADLLEVTELEYIQSSGTQYVDTLFNPTQNTQLVLDVAFLGSAGTNVAGVRNNSSDTINRFGIISFGSTSKLGAFFRDSSIQAVTFDNNRHLYDLSKDGLVFDGTSYGGANTGSFSCTYSLTLFAWNNGANGVTCNLCKVYSCQIYDNGTIIRDYIPCQTTAGEIGLWDDVNKVFYGNAGTGTFTAGPVKVSPLNLPVNIGGTWKDANEVFVNIGGTWKTVEAAFVNIDGTWKELG